MKRNFETLFYQILIRDIEITIYLQMDIRSLIYIDYFQYHLFIFLISIFDMQMNISKILT